jgi:hypothetical protein
MVSSRIKCAQFRIYICLFFYISVFVLKKVVKYVIPLDYVVSLLEKMLPACLMIMWFVVVGAPTYMLLAAMYGTLLPQECGCSHFMDLKLSSW